MFRKFVLCLLCIGILNTAAVNSASAYENVVIKDEELVFRTGTSMFAQAEYINDVDPVTGESYVRLAVGDFKELQVTASSIVAILQRVKDLEKTVKQVQTVIVAIQKFVNFARSALGIAEDDEIDNRDNEDLTGQFEHPESGIIMNPGSVCFRATTSDASETFDSLGIDALEMDLYFNQNLFTIDHMEGPGVIGDQITKGSLSRKQSAKKERASLPIADVQTNDLKFCVFLKPKKRSIKRGDKTKVRIEYFKRVPRNPDGTKGTAPILYSDPLTNDFIEVVVE